MKKETKVAIAALSITGAILLCTNAHVSKGISKLVYSVKYNQAITNTLNINRGTLLRLDIEESIKKNPFFLKERYDNQTEGYTFAKKFNPYLEEYGKYYSGSQVIDLKNVIENEYVIEDTSLNSAYEIYKAMLKTLRVENDFGDGIKKAYASSVIKEHFGYGGALEEGNLYWYFEQVTDILPRHTTAKYIIKGDIDGLIEELTQAYELGSEDKIKEILQLIDNHNLNTVDYEQQKEIVAQIEKLHKEILKNKLKNEKYKATLQGKIYQEYIDGHESYTYYHHTKDGIGYELHSDTYGSISIGTKTIKPTSTKSKSEIIIDSANELLNEEYKSEEKFSTQIIELCSYIIDWQYLTEFDTKNPIGSFWNSLSDYFATESELAEFIIALDNQNKVAVEKYLTIFTSQITKKEATMDSIAELKSLEEYYHDNSYRHAYNWNKEGYLSTLSASQVIKGSEEEQNFDIILEDFLFGEVDPEPYFIKARQHLATTALPINDSNTSIYATRDFRNGNKTYKQTDEVSVYSKEISPQVTTINNKQYVYYKIPEGYENGECIRVRQNIENEKFEEPVNGIKTTIYNYNTGKEEPVILVHIGISIDLSTFEKVVFKENYANMIEYIQNNVQNLSHTLRYTQQNQ